MFPHHKRQERSLPSERLQELSLKKKMIVGLDHQQQQLLLNPLYSVLDPR
jgi:hypothetical protein